MVVMGVFVIFGTVSGMVVILIVMPGMMAAMMLIVCWF